LLVFFIITQTCCVKSNFNVMLQKLARSEEEDVAGNYFKLRRASKLVAEAHEARKSK